jgi:hypothetical protein
VLAFGARPIELEPQHESHRGVRFRQLVVELEGLHRGSLGFRDRVGRRQHIVANRPEDVVGVGQARIREGIPRIGVDGLFEVLEAAHQVLRHALVPVVAPLQIQLVRLGALREPLRDPRFGVTRQCEAKVVRDLLRDLFLNGKNPGEGAAVLLAPDLMVVAPVDHFDAD